MTILIKCCLLFKLRKEELVCNKKEKKYIYTQFNYVDKFKKMITYTHTRTYMYIYI